MTGGYDDQWDKTRQLPPQGDGPVAPRGPVINAGRLWAGGVATAISSNALEWARSSGMEVTAAHEARQRTYTEKLLKLPADKAATIIVDGVERGRPRIRVGKDAVAVDRLVRLAPATATKVAVALERRLLRAEQQG